MIKIEIADICVGLNVDDAKTAQQILDRYADFLSPNGTPEVIVQVEVREGVQFVPLQGPLVINLTFQNDNLTFESHFERGFINMITGDSYLLMASDRSSVENFLRVLYAWRCLHQGGVLIHAAGVIKDGKAFVFFGPSHSGKTTIARLLLDHKVLSDDLVIIMKKDNTYKAYGVPFRGDVPEAPRTNDQADLHGLFRLKKDTSHFAKPLSYSHAVAELISCVPFVVEDLAMSQKAMDICTDLVASVPVKELHFNRDQGFWRVIDETG